MNIAIIGSGLAGMTAASALRHEHDITVFEKSRGASGRMCTRRRTSDNGINFAFDHGAQYFTIRGARFKQQLAPLIAAGIVQPWDVSMVTLAPDGTATPREHDAYVACPGMTALAKTIGADIPIHNGVEIVQITRQGLSQKWQLEDKDGQSHGDFDLVVSAIPAVQAANLMPTLAAKAKLEQVKMMACFTVMLGVDAPLNLPWGGAFVQDHLLGFIAVNSTKPARQGGTSLVVQANNEWAEPRIEYDPAAIEAEMHEAIKALIGIDANDAALTSFHRWRYAATQIPLGQSHIWDQEQGLAIIGDWCLKGRVEAAYDSGVALADAILASS